MDIKLNIEPLIFLIGLVSSLLLAAGKLTGVISWSWWGVFSPLIFVGALVVVAVFAAGILALIVAQRLCR
jgi:hypothetical protein